MLPAQFWEGGELGYFAVLFSVTGQGPVWPKTGVWRTNMCECGKRGPGPTQSKHTALNSPGRTDLSARLASRGEFRTLCTEVWAGKTWIIEMEELGRGQTWCLTTSDLLPIQSYEVVWVNKTLEVKSNIQLCMGSRHQSASMLIPIGLF